MTSISITCYRLTDNKSPITLIMSWCIRPTKNPPKDPSFSSCGCRKSPLRDYHQGIPKTVLGNMGNSIHLEYLTMILLYHQSTCQVWPLYSIAIYMLRPALDVNKLIKKINNFTNLWKILISKQDSIDIPHK